MLLIWYFKLICTKRNYSQSQWGNQVNFWQANSSIAFDEVPSFGVKWKICSKWGDIGPNHTWEVNNRVYCQPNAWAYSCIVMQILYFHLLKYNYQNEQKSQWSAFAYLWIFREQRNFWEHEFISSLHSQENKRERERESESRYTIK